MARSKAPEVHLSEDEKRERIHAAFPHLLDLEKQIEDARQQHLKPLLDARTKAWRTLKADTSIDRVDLELFYKLFKRDRAAEDMETAAEAERVRQNLRRVYEALRSGEMVDFLDVLMMNQAEDEPAVAAESQAGDFSEDVEQAEEAIAEHAPAPAPQDTTEGPDADWGDATAEQLQDGENQGGFAYQAGEKAGIAGQPLTELLKKHDKHPRSVWAKSAKAGWEAGAKQRAARQDAVHEANVAGNAAGYEGETLQANPFDAGTDEATAWAAGHEGGVIRRKNEQGADVVAFERPIPLPSVDGVAASSGDAA